MRKNARNYLILRRLCGNCALILRGCIGCNRNSRADVSRTATRNTDFVNEINLKPKSTIGAFQKKASTLSKKVDELSKNIPYKYNLPAIKSRISVLTTKIKTLDLYMQLNQIPDQKVIAILNETNIEITSLQMQMQEIIRKSLIPIEEYESDIIRMKDTSRAIPNTMNQIKPVPVE